MGGRGLVTENFLVVIQYNLRWTPSETVRNCTKYTLSQCNLGEKYPKNNQDILQRWRYINLAWLSINCFSGLLKKPCCKLQDGI